MKFKKSIILILCVLSALLFATGCSANTEYDFTGMVKVTFYLEGGEYRNCEGVVNYYYDFKPGESKRIKNPAAEKNVSTIDGKFVDSDVKRDGFVLEGWYRSKTETDGAVAYEGKWNFETDTVTSEGVELYAKWDPYIKYTYDICALDESGAPVTDADGNYLVLGSYIVKEGDGFAGDLLGYKDKRAGYTAVKGEDGGWFYNADGTPWDEEFKHPGGEKSTAVPVFVHYMKGSFEFVYTKEELLSYCKRAPWNNAFNPIGINLRADIDLGGEEFAGFPNFAGIFDGNGYKICNFKLKYGNQKTDLKTDYDLDAENNQLHISLFGGLRSADIKNVTFENVQIKVAAPYAGTKLVFVSPFCLKARDSKVENVKITGEIKEVTFFDGFDKESSYIAALSGNTLLPIPKIDGDKNFRNSTFTNIDLGGMIYMAL